MTDHSVPVRPHLVIGFDFGLRHIGTAVGQSVTQGANPLQTFKAHQGVPDWTRVQALVDQWQPQQLLVGLPLNMDDSESDMSALAREFADALKQQCGLPVAMVDERLTSFAAKQEAPDDAELQHQLAAVQIVQGYFNDPTSVQPA